MAISADGRELREGFQVSMCEDGNPYAGLAWLVSRDVKFGGSHFEGLFPPAIASNPDPEAL